MTAPIHNESASGPNPECLTRRQLFSAEGLQHLIAGFFSSENTDLNTTGALPIRRWQEDGDHQYGDIPRGRMVRAYVNRQYCLPWFGMPCSICVERCPEHGAIKVEQGRPTVVAQTCTGCGICYDTCPAPVNAILMLPQKRTTPRKVI